MDPLAICWPAYLAKSLVQPQKDVTKKRPELVFELVQNQVDKLCADIFVEAQFLVPCTEPFLQG